MLQFACPVCQKSLRDEGALLRCDDGHSFDKSKKGYVNLHLSSASSKKRHGDDKLMVLARRNFLDKGYYAPLLKCICETALRYAKPSSIGLVDAGCGEGYYTSGVKTALESAGKQVRAFGIDLSRDALTQARKRDSALNLAVASAKSLPFGNYSCDVLLSIFAPLFEEEFERVLSPNGIFIRAVPLEEHLFGLKKAVYDSPYLNPPISPELAGMQLLGTNEVRYTLTLDNAEDICALFAMTPYYYKTGQADQAKLRQLPRLETELAFGVWAYTAPVSKISRD